MHAIWITGLSRSGKTTLAQGLAQHFRSSNQVVEIVDGAEVRRRLGNVFGYSREERIRLNRVLCTMAGLLTRNGVITIVPAITPLEECREYNRRELPSYTEIHLSCPAEVCRQRDVRDEYEQALRGDLDHFVGIDDPYELPRSPDLCLDTSLLGIDDTLEEAILFLQEALVYA